jgi:DNA-binding response OmpR family regulator
MKSKKILYVEDNKDTAEAVKIILSSVGHEVDLAHTGAEGLIKMSEKKYDLIILDIMLPDMSGLDLQKKNQKGKFLFLSVMSPKEQEKKKGKKHHYIAKPFTKKDLTKKIGELLEDEK